MAEPENATTVGPSAETLAELPDVGACFRPTLAVPLSLRLALEVWRALPEGPAKVELASVIWISCGLFPHRLCFAEELPEPSRRAAE